MQSVSQNQPSMAETMKQTFSMLFHVKQSYVQHSLSEVSAEYLNILQSQQLWLGQCFQAVQQIFSA